jgi:ATP-binding cassette subfamily B protein
MIIGHRMRSVSGADKIVVIKDGSIAETGSPQELKEKQGLFASMLKTQLQSN